MLDGFSVETIDVSGVSIRARRAGNGPPLLLMHGNPQTHVMWHKIAPRLAEHFAVVATDLRGYGDSAKPPTDARHLPYSKRAMAVDQVGVMRACGFERFYVVGHDRGGRVGYRMALDAPEAVQKLAVLDIIPTGDAYAKMNLTVALGYWQWLLLAQPFDIPEHLIGLDPEWFWHRFVGGDGGKPPAFFAPEAVAEYLRCFRRPENIHGMCEDLRAAATIDCELDWADQRAGRKIACPLLVLWGKNGSLPQWYDVAEVWRGWSSNLSGQSLPTGHYIAEEAPDETAQALIAFLKKS
jgi:haloacetate dehalogenase